jgi:hypothetical protein
MLSLWKNSIAFRGIVTLNSIMTEENIRACLAEAIVIKFLSVVPQDLDFLKANRRKISMLENFHLKKLNSWQAKDASTSH